MDRETGKGQKAKGKGKGNNLFSHFLLILTFCLLPFALCPLHNAGGADKWPGVDESVVEKISREQGREAREPFINTDQGDLLLFVFLLAGALGGFLAGYYWRMLMEGKDR